MLLDLYDTGDNNQPLFAYFAVAVMFNDIKSDPSTPHVSGWCFFTNLFLICESGDAWKQN